MFYHINVNRLFGHNFVIIYNKVKVAEYYLQCLSNRENHLFCLDVTRKVRKNKCFDGKQIYIHLIETIIS